MKENRENTIDIFQYLHQKKNDSFFQVLFFHNGVKKLKILVVEDSLVSQQAVKKFLSDHIPNANFLFAGDGKEGLRLYQKERPDLIILDLLMPLMDGHEVLKEIRQKDQETKIVVITANIQSMVKKEIQDEGVLAFINKPLTREKAKDLALLLQDPSQRLLREE